MTSIGQLRQMDEARRKAAIAGHGMVGRLKLAHLASYALVKVLDEAYDLRVIIQELTAEPTKPEPPLDPEPWYVVEVERRYTTEQYAESASDGEHGGIIYNIAQWKPREGYAQNQEDYS